MFKRQNSMLTAATDGTSPWQQLKQSCCKFSLSWKAKCEKATNRKPQITFWITSVQLHQNGKRIVNTILKRAQKGNTIHTENKKGEQDLTPMKEAMSACQAAYKTQPSSQQASPKLTWLAFEELLGCWKIHISELMKHWWFSSSFPSLCE